MRHPAPRELRVQPCRRQRVRHEVRAEARLVGAKDDAPVGARAVRGRNLVQRRQRRRPHGAASNKDKGAQSRENIVSSETAIEGFKSRSFNGSGVIGHLWRGVEWGFFFF